MAKTKQGLALQLVVGIISTIPIFVGLNGIFSGPSMLEKAYKYPVQVESHFRYLSGIAVGMGLLLLRSLPKIDRDGSDLRRVALLIFIGGLGRLWSLLALGLEFEFSLVMVTLTELLLFPFLCLWQNQVQKTSMKLYANK